MTGYVYFLYVDDYKFFKYGYSANVEKRIQTLQTGSPYKWELYRKIKCKDIESARQIEKKIKDQLRGRCKRKFGEVFESPRSAVDTLIFEITVKWKELYPEWRINDDNSRN